MWESFRVKLGYISVMHILRCLGNQENGAAHYTVWYKGQKLEVLRIKGLEFIRAQVVFKATGVDVFFS